MTIDSISGKKSIFIHPPPLYAKKNKEALEAEALNFNSLHSKLLFNYFSFKQFKNPISKMSVTRHKNARDKNWRRVTLDKRVQRVEVNSVIARSFFSQILTPVTRWRFETSVYRGHSWTTLPAEWQIRVEIESRLFPCTVERVQPGRGIGTGRKPAVDARHSVSLIALINKGQSARERTASDRGEEGRGEKKR